MPGLKFFINSLILFTAVQNSAFAASTPETLSLTPFTASYEVDWKSGISLSGSTVRKLATNESGGWTFESKASAMFASVFESSQFQLQGQQIKPLNYHFKQSVLGKKRIADVSFDWENLQVTNDVENKPWKMDISKGVQDKLSYQLLLQQDVAQGLQEFNYTVADGGKLKQYKFIVDGKEVIEAPIGTFESIRVKRIRDGKKNRETFIWFAPELGYQIIKLHQTEKKDKSYSLLLKELKN
ncbi:MAG: DUF3108 domain-containing protein [Neptuniibacter sp.]